MCTQIHIQLEKNPKGTVPIMEKDGKVIPDSDVIIVQVLHSLLF